MIGRQTPPRDAARSGAASFVVLVLITTALLSASQAFGDSLLLKDGRLITGKVSRTETGYVIRTKAGELTFNDNDVEHWTQSESADPAESPAIPSTSSGQASAAKTSAPTGKPALSPSAPGGAVKDKISQQKSVAKLVERGNTALAGNDYKAARDAFADALLLEGHNAAAAEGLGYAYLQLTPPNYFKARDALEIAYSAMQPPPRSLACDLALALAQTHNPMRSAKVLKDYLTAHPTPLDEPALNALAAALFQADDQVRRNSFYIQAGQFYDDYNKKLEATRPGKKRWGTSWLPAAQADKKLKTYFDKRAKIEQLTRRMADDKAAYDSASEESTSAVNSLQTMAGRAAALNQQMQEARADFNEAKAALAKAQEGFELPPINASLAVVEPEAATAVATAAPTGAESTTLSAIDLSAGTPSVPKPGSTGSPKPGAARPPKTGSGQHPPVSSGSPPPTVSPVVIAAQPAEPAPKRRLRIESNAVAFPIGPDLVVTAAEAVNDANYITLQIPGADTMTADVVSSDDASGLALLHVQGKPLAYLPLADAFAAGPVTCIGFPEVNLFDPVAASITGTIAPAAGAAGKFIVSLSRSPRLGGGPLLASGKVIAVQLANRDSDPHAIAIATLADLKKLLATAGPPGTPTPGFDPKSITMQLTAIKESR